MYLIIWLSIFFHSFLPQPQQGGGAASAPSVQGSNDERSLIPDSLIRLRSEASLKSWKLKSPESVLNTLSKKPVAERDYEPLRPPFQQAWLFYPLLALLFFIAFIRFNNVREFQELFYIFKPIGINQQLFRDALAGVRISSVLLNINLVIVAGFYAYLLAGYYHWREVNWQFLCFLVFVVGVVLLARFGLLKIATSLFPFKKEISFYHFNELQINRVTGLLLLPLLFLMAFSTYPFSFYALVLSFVLITAMLLFRYIRGFMIGREYFARNKFHFLLYICTLEIAPILIFVKLLKEWAA